MRRAHVSMPVVGLATLATLATLAACVDVSGLQAGAAERAADAAPEADVRAVDGKDAAPDVAVPVEAGKDSGERSSICPSTDPDAVLCASFDGIPFNSGFTSSGAGTASPDTVTFYSTPSSARLEGEDVALTAAADAATSQARAKVVIRLDALPTTRRTLLSLMLRQTDGGLFGAKVDIVDGASIAIERICQANACSVPTVETVEPIALPIGAWFEVALSLRFGAGPKAAELTVAGTTKVLSLKGPGLDQTAWDKPFPGVAIVTRLLGPTRSTTAASMVVRYDDLLVLRRP